MNIATVLTIWSKRVGSNLLSRIALRNSVIATTYFLFVISRCSPFIKSWYLVILLIAFEQVRTLCFIRGLGDANWRKIKLGLSLESRLKTEERARMMISGHDWYLISRNLSTDNTGNVIHEVYSWRDREITYCHFIILMSHFCHCLRQMNRASCVALFQ